MKLFVARHGQTIANSLNLVCGITESELTEAGRDQAARLASEFLFHKEEYNIQYIYVSPLKRARDTCRYVERTLAIRAVVEPRLTEFNFGTSEGISCEDAGFRKKRTNPYARFENGESILFAARRLYNLIDEIRMKHAPRNENVLFICHGTVGRIIDTYFHNVSTEYFTTYQIRNCEIKHYEL